MRDKETGEYHYVPRGSVRKPCPGCGETKIYPRDSICNECRSNLRLAERIKATHIEQAQAEREVVFIPATHQSMPYLSHAYGRREYDDEARYRIRKPLHALAYALSEETNTGSLRYGDIAQLWKTERAYGDQRRVMKTEHVAILRTLLSDIQTALNTAHADGAQEGKNLLLSLAEGSITSDDFNDRAARLTGNQS